MSDDNINLARFRLEASVQDVIEKGKEYLIDEFRNVLESNKPYQTKADYIGYSILSIDEKINLLNQEIENLLDVSTVTETKPSKLKINKRRAVHNANLSEITNDAIAA